MQERVIRPSPRIMRTRLLRGFLALVCWWGAPAAAQMATSLHVVVDELSEDAGTCGIDMPLIASAAARTLRDNGIGVVAGMADPYSYLYVAAQVSSMRNAADAPMRCVVDARVQVVDVSPTRTPLGGFKGLKPTRNTTETVRCSSAGNRSGLATDLGQELRSDLKRWIELCLAKVG